MLDAEARECCHRGALAFGARDAAKRETDRCVIEHGAIEQKRTLEDHRDLAAIGEGVTNKLTPETQLALRGEERRESQYERGLPRAVRAQDRERLSVFDGHAVKVDDLTRATVHRQARGLDDRRHQFRAACAAAAPMS